MITVICVITNATALNDDLSLATSRPVCLKCLLQAMSGLQLVSNYTRKAEARSWSSQPWPSNKPLPLNRHFTTTDLTNFRLESWKLVLAVTNFWCIICIASFPGPAQLSILQVTERWAGPGNKAIICNQHSPLKLFKVQSSKAYIKVGWPSDGPAMWLYVSLIMLTFIKNKRVTSVPSWES